MCSDGDCAIESILRPHYHEVYRLFLNPRDAARKLYADGVFAESALDDITEESRSLQSQKDCFFKHLKGVIRGGGHTHLKLFARVLLNSPNTANVAECLLTEYDHQFPESQTVHAQISPVNSQEAEEYRISQVYKGKFQDKRGELGTLFLRCIAKHFDLQEAGGLIKLYDDSISRFCEEIPVEHSYAQDFMEHFRGKCLKSETVKFVLDWKADEKSLNDIRGILKKAFHKMAHNVKVMVVSEGNSIIVICYAPPHLAAVLTRLVE